MLGVWCTALPRRAALRAVDGPRALYIFGCNRQACASVSSTWRVFRSRRFERAVASTTTTSGTVARRAGDDGGSWSLGADESALDAQIENLLRARDAQPPVPPPPPEAATDSGGAAGPRLILRAAL